MAANVKHNFQGKLVKPKFRESLLNEQHVLKQVCKSNPFHTILAELYNVILAIVATLYAFLVRNVDSNFSESKWISYAMYSVCVSWMIDGVLLVFAVGEKANVSKLSVPPEVKNCVLMNLNHKLKWIFGVW